MASLNGAGGAGGAAGVAGGTAGEGGMHVPIPPGDPAAQALPCNGWVPLCDRAYDTVVQPVTHAAAANNDLVWDHPAHLRTITEQLLDRISGLMFEVHDRDGELVICVADCDAGETSLSRALDDIRDYLDGNPRDVITLLLDNRAPAADIEEALTDAGLGGELHVQAPDDDWPTLQQMIDDERRLAVFVYSPDPDASRLLSLWDFAWETAPDHTEESELDCNAARGSERAPLALLNHYLVVESELAAGGAGGDAPGYADLELATWMNERAVLAERLDTCLAQHGRTPSFIAVDYYDTGDLLLATQLANDLIVAPPEPD